MSVELEPWKELQIHGKAELRLQSIAEMRVATRQRILQHIGMHGWNRPGCGWSNQIFDLQAWPVWVRRFRLLLRRKCVDVLV